MDATAVAAIILESSVRLCTTVKWPHSAVGHLQFGRFQLSCAISIKAVHGIDPVLAWVLGACTQVEKVPWVGTRWAIVAALRHALAAVETPALGRVHGRNGWPKCLSILRRLSLHLAHNERVAMGRRRDSCLGSSCWRCFILSSACCSLSLSYFPFIHSGSSPSCIHVFFLSVWRLEKHYFQ